MAKRVDIRVETFKGNRTVLAVFEDEEYWRPNEREILTDLGVHSQLDSKWYRKYTRPATYNESRHIIDLLVGIYDDFEFCKIDWQAHSKRARKERKEKDG